MLNEAGLVGRGAARVLDDGLLLPAAFAAQVERTPDAPALTFREHTLSYRELDRRALRLAHRLRAHGVGPEVRVGIFAERTPELVIAVLAVHKAGGAYVPIDASTPPDRVQFLVEDTAMAVLLTEPKLHGKLGPLYTRVLYLASEPGISSEPPLEELAESHHLAYVIYTSGSTGTPKGVMVEHGNVRNLFAAMDDVLGSEPGVWLSVTSLSFDISVVELLWSLARGFEVVLYREPARDGNTGLDAPFASLLRDHRVTHLQCTPTMATIFLADPAARAELHTLRELILAGEAYPITLARQLRTYTAATLRNIYGPTETTVYSVAHQVDATASTVPIGSALTNTELFVLDAERQPVARGKEGELYIGGAGVARGYLHRPDLTQERFVVYRGKRVYRTGDLVRQRTDGTLDYLGRIDQQVKLRGYRLELGEIENVLAQHPDVREAVVLLREDMPGNKRLVAYVISERPTPASVLKSFLKTKLPPYMVPSAVAFLDTFPQTVSGKLDRKALPVPERLRANAPLG